MASASSTGEPSELALWVTVRDARRERPAHAIGVARMTMGIPREISQAGGEWDVARAIGHGLGTGLQNSGWEAVGFDPPDPRLVLPTPERGAPPHSPPGTKLPGWTLRVVIDRLWGDGYFGEYSFKIGLRLHLLDERGDLKARAEFRQEFVESYNNPTDLAYQLETKTREALTVLLVDAGFGSGFPEARRVSPFDRTKRLEDADYFYNKWEKSKLDEDDEDEDEADGDPPPTCPKCQRAVEASWKHCPDCGTSLGEPK